VRIPEERLLKSFRLSVSTKSRTSKYILTNKSVYRGFSFKMVYLNYNTMLLQLVNAALQFTVDVDSI
jgi:hypothetical protein